MGPFAGFSHPKGFEPMIRITHVINNLQVGGAELSLLRLIQGMDRNLFDPSVVSLIGEGTVGPRLRGLDVPVVSLGAARGSISPLILMSLKRQLRRLRPDVIQSWMYHSNLAAYLVRGTVPGKPPLAWNIRHSLSELHREKWLTRLVIGAGARRSKRVEAIVSNSSVSLRQHEAIGYRSRRNIVIPNAVDLDAFRPLAGSREDLRRTLGLGPDALLVGGVGRFHPMKDHGLLARAVALAAERGRDLHCVIAGRGYEVEADTVDLRSSSGLGDRLHLLPENPSIASLYSGLDLFAVSSRWGEGFPNVLAEAMACGTPCVSTEVGDASLILDDPSRIVPAGDVEAMAGVIGRLMDLSSAERCSLGSRDREHIGACYRIGDVVDRYQRLWTDLAAEGRVGS